MPASIILTNPAHIDACIGGLKYDFITGCSLQSNGSFCNGTIDLDKTAASTLTFISEKRTNVFRNGDSAECVLFSANIKLVFTSTIIHVSTSEVEITKPNSIAVTRPRKSGRYKPEYDGEIVLTLPSLNLQCSVLDIGITGVAILLNSPCSTPDRISADGILHTDEYDFYVYCRSHYRIKLENNTFRYGIEITFIDTASFFKHLEWIFHKINPDIVTPSYLSQDMVKDNFNRTLTTFFNNDMRRTSELEKELILWADEQHISPLQCNIASIKGGKLMSAASIRRIYTSTFTIERLVCIPGIHLYDIPKLSLYSALSDMLDHHPGCNHLIFYRDRDQEWHEKVFREIAAHCTDPDSVYLDNLEYVDLHTSTETCSHNGLRNTPYTVTPMNDLGEFQDFIQSTSNAMVTGAYNYLSSSSNEMSFSDLLCAAHHSMTRRFYRIHTHDHCIGFSVCEAYRTGYFTQNVFDMCRIYLIKEPDDFSQLLETVSDTVSQFFAVMNKQQFRMVWKKEMQGIRDVSHKDELFRGTLLRFILGKNNFSSFSFMSRLLCGKSSEYLHLSYPQQSIWYYEQRYPGTTINTIFCTVTLGKNIDFSLLARAINIMINQNDSMRIRITNRYNTPCQYIRNAENIEIPYIDFKDLSNRKSFSAFSAELQQSPFILHDSDLVNFVMFSKEDSECGYFIKIHHIIADAWTVGIIYNQIKGIYSALTGKCGWPEKPAPSYREFLEHEFSYRFSDKMPFHEKFWIDTLNHESSIDTSRGPLNQSNDGASARSSFTIGKNTAREILGFIKKNSGTPFSFFISCVYIYLHRISGNTDITIGTSVLNRSNHRERMCTGLFVSARPLRVLIDIDLSFKDFMRHVSLDMRRLLKNHQYPSELISKSFREKNSRNGSLYDLTFTYQFHKLENEFSLIWHPYRHQMEPLNIHVSDWNGKGLFYFDYDYQTACFSEEDIYRLHEIIMCIMNYAIRNPDATVRNIPLVTPQMARTILHSFNKTLSPFPQDKTIHQLFEQQVIATPDAIAVTDADYSLTYDMLNRNANRLANLLFLRHQGRTGNFIAIVIENSILQIEAQLGVLKSGNAYVPITTTTPKLRLRSIIDEANITTLITLGKHSHLVSSFRWECPSLTTIIFLDTHETCVPESHTGHTLMNIDLWRHIGEQATDYITAGGWISSYTGNPFTVQEMEEYGDNVLLKLKPYCTPSTTVLEIGCASGITMFRIAPIVKHYHGTDLSDAVITRNQHTVSTRDIPNITLSVLPAHEISSLKGNCFNIIIINSVIQAFPGYNYLSKIIADAIEKLGSTGILFIGDVMDLDMKVYLTDSLKEYKKNNPDTSSKTKTDFPNELFVPKAFFNHMQDENSSIQTVEFSEKIHTIENELTRFRYDVLLHIDKSAIPHTTRAVTEKSLLGTNNIHQMSDSNLNVPCIPSSPAYMIFTSGTSGTPKGVMIGHTSVVNLCWWYKRYYRLKPKDRIARSISFGFDPAVADLFPGLISGATIHIIPDSVRNDPALLNDYFNRNGITVCILPTPLFELFQEYHNTSLRLVVVGGDKLSKYIKNNYTVVNNYGPTEYTVITTVFPVTRQHKNIPIGKPIANTRIYILDINNNLMPIGFPGELCISGDGLALGYLNDIDSNKFIENPFEPGSKLYRTGDKAQWLKDGTIEFIGRMDDQVKIRGFRIELREIESVLLQHEAINRVAVFVKAGASGSRYLCACYESPSLVFSGDLTGYLSSRLPDYMVPTVFIHLFNFPLLSSGKIDRQQLMEIDDPSINQDIGFIDLQTKTETIVASIWSRILNRTIVNTETNFFSIGGDSLNAIEVCSLFSKKNIIVSIQDLYNHPTVTALASYIDQKDTGVADDTAISFTVRKDKESIEKITFEPSKRTARNILLTGTTGYVGMHLLRNLLNSTDAHLFCLVHGNDEKETVEKFRNHYGFYFGDSEIEPALERITLLTGELRDKDLGLPPQSYKKVSGCIDTIFHAAAMIKLYGTYEDFRDVNYCGLTAISKLAQTSGARLHYISTMGIAGGIDIPQEVQGACFTENDLYIGQHYRDNPYVRSKFEAENYLLHKINSGFNAVIYRLGLVTERWTDGIFQKNADANFFHAIFRAFLAIRMIPENVLDYTIDLSPVDLCSTAIVKLSEIEALSGKIFHIYNPNKISFGYLFKLIEPEVGTIAMLPRLSHQEFCAHLHATGCTCKEAINKLEVDFNIDRITDNRYTCVWKADITQRYLQHLGFTWPRIDTEYTGKMIRYLRKIGFLPTTR